MSGNRAQIYDMINTKPSPYLFLQKFCDKQGKRGWIMGIGSYSKATRETAENLRIIDDAMFRQ